MTTKGRGKPPGKVATDEPGQKPAARPQFKVILGGAGQPEEQPAMPSTPQPLAAPGEAVLRRVADIVGAERAFLFIWNDEEFTLQLGRVRPSSPDEAIVDPKGLWPLLDRVVAERRPLVMGLTEEAPADVRVSGVTEQLRMGIAVPLLTEESMAGVLCLDRRLSRGMFVDSDVTVVQATMQALGIDARGVAQLLEGEEQAAQAMQVLDVLPDVQRALTQQQSETKTTGKLTPDARLREPQGRFLDFWHRRELSGGRSQLLLARLCLAADDRDMPVKALTACYRTLSQISELGVFELARGLQSALAPVTGDSYWLGLSIVQYDPEDGSMSCWRAGDGIVVAEGAGGTRVVLGAQAPLDAECDELVHVEWKAAPTDRVYCFASCGSGGMPEAGDEALRSLSDAGVSVVRASLS